MKNSGKLAERIFNITGNEDFSGCAMEVFRFQHEHCEVYRAFTDALSVDPARITRPENIPFMPIEFFKTREVICRGEKALKVFHSSGTGDMSPSRHLIAAPVMYETSFLKGFRQVYGDPSAYTFLALTPRPEDNPYSSLIYMIRSLMQQNPGPAHGFYLDNQYGLMQQLSMSSARRSMTVLFGLTWALLDFAEKYPGDYSGLIIVETGGMKGRRREITREELHKKLQKGFSGAEIHSEYGMTELLSQAWSGPDGIFSFPPWMRILIREVNDPFTYTSYGRTGGINIIDLANLYSCSFLATEDLGRAREDGKFEVLGRFDSSELRGCSLMTEE
jgi:hypothetical protein